MASGIGGVNFVDFVILVSPVQLRRKLISHISTSLQRSDVVEPGIVVPPPLSTGAAGAKPYARKTSSGTRDFQHSK
jgi:hypothetical protein